MSNKLILHLDMDAFFATAEQSLNPNLVNKPIAVCHSSKRAVITAVSYEAKKYGVHAGMPLFKAKTLCSDLIAVSPTFNHYSKLSKKFFDFICKNFTKKIEIKSIDECNIDATYLVKRYTSTMDLMIDIQTRVYKYLKLKVSIGASWNAEIAKIAANLNKPMGLREIKKSELKTIVWRLPVESISGIGKVATKYLKINKIHTIEDLAKAKDSILFNIFGKTAPYFKNVAHGIGNENLLLSHPDQKSLSKERTFEDPPSREDGLLFVHELAKNICERVNAQDMVFGVIRVSGKNLQKERFSIQKTLTKKTVIYENIMDMIEPLFDELFSKHGPFILISFGTAHLVNKMDYLHNNKNNWSENEIGHDVATTLNKNFNKRIVMTGSEWSKHRKVSYHDRFLKGEKTNE